MAYKPKNTHQRILHRLKIALGQLNNVVEMADKHEYCISIINQSQAVQEALRSVDNLILENHLKHCVVDAIKQGQDKKVINEVLKVVAKTK